MPGERRPSPSGVLAATEGPAARRPDRNPRRSYAQVCVLLGFVLGGLFTIFWGVVIEIFRLYDNRFLGFVISNFLGFMNEIFRIFYLRFLDLMIMTFRFCDCFFLGFINEIFRIFDYEFLGFVITIFLRGVC